MLRPWLEGNLAGCPGGELLALGLPEGGMGLFVLHPQALAANIGLPATAEARPASNFMRSVSGSGPSPWFGGWGVRASKKKKKTPPFDCFLYSFPGLFSTVPFPMPARDTKEDATGWGAGGRGGAGAWGEGGGSKSAPFHQHLFPFSKSSWRISCTDRPGRRCGLTGVACGRDHVSRPWWCPECLASSSVCCSK